MAPPEPPLPLLSASPPALLLWKWLATTPPPSGTVGSTKARRPPDSAMAPPTPRGALLPSRLLGPPNSEPVIWNTLTASVPSCAQMAPPPASVALPLATLRVKVPLLMVME